jgi:hypothetical protein
VPDVAHFAPSLAPLAHTSETRISSSPQCTLSVPLTTRNEDDGPESPLGPSGSCWTRRICGALRSSFAPLAGRSRWSLCTSFSLRALRANRTLRAWRAGFATLTGRALRANGARPAGDTLIYSGAASGELVAGLAGLAGDSTACDDGALRCCGAALGSGLACPGG